ncbi:MAG TPA: gamma-glutamyl-gamma-aminobutyrate hydrolase family protein [Acidimicrobiales bacterium]
MSGTGATMARIGLTASVEHARWGTAWAESAALLPAAYVSMVAAAGGLPLVLPPVVPGVPWGSADALDAEALDRAAAVAVAGVDGVVLTGGSDVDPAAYGATAHPETDAPQATRDAWELAVLRAALAADLPVLAVCRGAQVLNVARGGTLVQHLPDVVGARTHRPVPGTYGRVDVRIEPGSRLAVLVGAAPRVSCHHHQAVDRLGDGLAVCARATDGTVEAVELAGARFALGVQWHPEEDGDVRLFAALVEAAGGRAP